MSSEQRKPLTGILPNNQEEVNFDFLKDFDSIEAADNLGPVPRGVYVGLAIEGKWSQAKPGKLPYYTITFKIIEGEFEKRRVWRNFHFTPDAKPFSKRDLGKLGIRNLQQLQQPFQVNRLVCRLTVVVQTGNDGITRNEVKDFTVIRVQEPETNPFDLDVVTGQENEGGES